MTYLDVSRFHFPIFSQGFAKGSSTTSRVPRWGAQTGRGSAIVGLARTFT